MRFSTDRGINLSCNKFVYAESILVFGFFGPGEHLLKAGQGGTGGGSGGQVDNLIGDSHLNYLLEPPVPLPHGPGLYGNTHNPAAGWKVVCLSCSGFVFSVSV